MNKQVFYTMLMVTAFTLLLTVPSYATELVVPINLAESQQISLYASPFVAVVGCMSVPEISDRFDTLSTSIRKQEMRLTAQRLTNEPYASKFPNTAAYVKVINDAVQECKTSVLSVTVVEGYMRESQ